MDSKNGNRPVTADRAKRAAEAPHDRALEDAVAGSAPGSGSVSPSRPVPSTITGEPANAHVASEVGSLALTATAPPSEGAPAAGIAQRNGHDAPPRKPARCRGGRKLGTPKTGGRRKPLAYKPGRAGRFEIAERSGVLEFLARMCAGKPIAMRGPTGKLGLYHYPTIEDRKWAASQLLPRVLPALAPQQIGGEEPDQRAAGTHAEVGTDDAPKSPTAFEQKLLEWHAKRRLGRKPD